MRQLVTVRTVSEILPIEGADRIELAKIDGWQCVVSKGEFTVGSKGFYCEIDSMMPGDDPRFQFLGKGKVAPAFRVKTVRLKKVLSQGLLQPLSKLTAEELKRLDAGEDLTTILKVQKYEPPLPIGGQQYGTFPTHLIPKTDQERIQNIPDTLVDKSFVQYEVTEKLDGTSCTIWFHTDGSINLDEEKGHPQYEMCKNTLVHVASCNWEMKKEDENVYSKILRDNNLVDKLCDLRRNLALQGEIIGPAIQGNKYHLAKQEFFVFDIYDIDAKKYLPFFERWELVEKLGLKHVPVLREELHKHFNFVPEARMANGLTLENVLALADGKSALNPNAMREGLVFKATDGSHSFKAISNEWLLKHE